MNTPTHATDTTRRAGNGTDDGTDGATTTERIHRRLFSDHATHGQTQDATSRTHRTATTTRKETR